MKKLICLLLGHDWMAYVWRDHVSLKCRRCGRWASAEFDGPQPNVPERPRQGGLLR